MEVEVARVRHALPALESLQLGYNRLEGAPACTCMYSPGFRVLGYSVMEAEVARVRYALQLGYNRLEGAPACTCMY